ncbi:MAG: effector binding domain-containing protein [Planctomycetes bacterium]|nr:effector binding domain-containing protein [Planctomycetota bacterium]
MKVMVIVKASASSEAGDLPSTELLTAMGRYNEELAQAGILVDAAGLKPSSCGARVHFSGTGRTVIDGPFAETKELIAGFWIWRVNSLQEAIDWVRKCPNPMMEDSDIEIRPLFEAADFGEQFTPELREQEAGVLATTLGLNAPRFTLGPELVIAGLNQTYTRETRVEIPQQWSRFVARMGELSRPAGDFYGVCWNTTPDCEFDYLTGVEWESHAPVAEDFTSVKLIARRYAVFTHTGHVTAIPDRIDAIWTKWVPDCGLNIAKAPCFERYTAEFNKQTGTGGIELWIPLES